MIAIGRRRRMFQKERLYRECQRDEKRSYIRHRANGLSPRNAYMAAVRGEK